MLSHADYNNLWTNPIPNGFGQTTVSPPSYHEYVQREIYFRDYLDLFSNTSTYMRVLIGGRYYVQITGNPVLGALEIPNLAPYCISIEGIDYILVDYDYPWTEDELNVERSIQYIMIGEAAPNRKMTFVNYNKDCNQNTYFYNKKHIGNTAWINAPCNVFNFSEKDKGLKLLHLATSGYLNIDILPFSLNYDTISRNLLIDTALFLFSEHVLNLIDQLRLNGYLFNNQAQLAFSGPPILHHYLANQINVGHIHLPHFIHCNAVPNTFVPLAVPIITRVYLYSWPLDTLLNGIYERTLETIPIYRCCCYDGSFVSGPHQLFIRNAFGLP